MKMRLLGLEPRTYGLKVRSANDVSAEDKELTEISNPSGSTEGSSHAKPAANLATDSLLATLASTTENAILSDPEPSLRFVVQHWPDLTEDDQRAILSIVRRADIESIAYTDEACL